LENIDLLLAKSHLAIKFNMTRPQLNPMGKSIKIKNGIHIPMEEKCELLQTKYTLVNVEFNNRLIVINGSNMGGKTVMLKSIGFMQILAQTGFFVPAEKFETVLFEHIHYIGETNFDAVNGLSSFGLEISCFINTLTTSKTNTLYLIDEFARTTNTLEAESLISAILEMFNANEKIYLFLSTHFMNIISFDNLSFYKMKGLNYLEYKKYYTENKMELSERIKIINSFMDFQVELDNAKTNVYDAINVAEILGLDSKIIEKAKCMLKTKAK